MDRRVVAVEEEAAEGEASRRRLAQFLSRSMPSLAAEDPVSGLHKLRASLRFVDVLYWGRSSRWL
jgi:hypothetical protein